MSHPPTDEQLQAIHRVLVEKKSAVLQAVPGSGKSTLFQQLILAALVPGFATAFPKLALKECTWPVEGLDEPRKNHPTFLIVSYNTTLKEETIRKISRLQEQFQESCPHLFSSVGVMTFHGLISHYSKRVVYNDLDFRNVLQQLEDGTVSPRNSKWNRIQFLLLDETQDMRLDYCRLVTFLLRTSFLAPDLRVVLVGDVRQLLYSMYSRNYADSRFMDLAPVYLHAATEGRLQFEGEGRKQIELTKTFRLPPTVTAFANCVLCAPWNDEDLRKAEPMVSASSESLCQPVHLFVVNLYLQDAVEIVLPLLRDIQSRSPSSETVLLTTSLNSRSVVKKMVQAMSRDGIRVLVETSGDIAKNSGLFSAPPPAPVFTHCTRKKMMGTSESEDDGAVVCEERAEEAVAPVRVQTFHSFKGMEGDDIFVFNPGRLFPLSRALFVALTRSRRNLFILQDQRSISMEHVEYLSKMCRSQDLQIHLHRQPSLRPAVPVSLPISLPMLSHPPHPPHLPHSSLYPHSFRRKEEVDRETGANGTKMEERKEEQKEEQKECDGKLSTKRWRRQINKKDLANFFSFMDIDHIQYLLSFVQSRNVRQPIFPVDAMYHAGLWEIGNVTEKEERNIETEVEVETASKEADTGAFIRFCDSQGPGTLGILGDVILLVLHAFFFGELPQEYTAFTSRKRLKDRSVYDVETKVAQVVGNDFWERLRAMMFQIQDLAQLHVDFVSERGFEDASVLHFDPVCCVHATVFRRIEGTALLFLERLSQSSEATSVRDPEDRPCLPFRREDMVFWRESMVRMPESAPFKFMAAKAFFGIRGQTVLQLQSSIKTDNSEDLLEAAFTAVAFGCERTEIINVVELSVQEVSLRNEAEAAKTQFEFVSAVVDAKTAKRVEYTDQEFMQRILFSVQ